MNYFKWRLSVYERHTQLAAVIFFIAFVQMMYYLGVMQWVIGKLYGIRTLMYIAANTIRIHSAWLFFKLMAVSGAEAVVAAASPWVGQGESACLVRPYVDCKHGSSHPPHIKTPFHPLQHSDDRI